MREKVPESRITEFLKSKKPVEPSDLAVIIRVRESPWDLGLAMDRLISGKLTKYRIFSAISVMEKYLIVKHYNSKKVLRRITPKDLNTYEMLLLGLIAPYLVNPDVFKSSFGFGLVESTNGNPPPLRLRPFVQEIRSSYSEERLTKLFSNLEAKLMRLGLAGPEMAK